MSHYAYAKPDDDLDDSNFKPNRLSWFSDKKKKPDKKNAAGNAPAVEVKTETSASQHFQPEATGGAEMQAQQVGQQIAAGQNGTVSKNAPGTGIAAAQTPIHRDIESGKGGGQALDKETKDEMEEKLGADLSEVRVHDDGSANRMAEAIGAKAFAHGQDIYFAKGQGRHNKELLAHELAHTVQQQGGEERVQRSPDDEGRKSFRIVIPAGTKTKQELYKYAELVIFGKLVNINWESTSEAGKTMIETPANYAGQTVVFSVSLKVLAQYGLSGADKNDAQTASNEYDNAGGQTKKELTEEINKRYYDNTNVKPGTQIGAGDAASIAVWNEFKKQVVKEKIAIDKLPPEVRSFINAGTHVKPEDYSRIAPVAMLLNRFTATDFLDYGDKVNIDTADLEELRKSLEAYLAQKEKKQKNTEKRESIKAKLYGLEGLYKAYKDYKRFEQNHYHTLYEPKDPNKNYFSNALEEQRLALEENVKANGFESIDEFEKYISNYTKAFEQETLSVALEHLELYRHSIYEEEKKFKNDSYIHQLFTQLKATGAQALYESSKEKGDKAGSMIMKKEVSMSEWQTRDRLLAESGKEKQEAEEKVNSLPAAGPLIKEKEFDRAELTKANTEAELKTLLLEKISEKYAAIEETRSDLLQNPDHIYKLPELLASSIKTQNIEPGSIYDAIINDKKSELRNVVIAQTVLTIVAAVFLTIVSFGAAAPVLITAGAASLGISLYGVYEAIESYKRENAAHEVGLLADDPSMAWVVLAIAGAALDLAALNSAFKSARPISEAAKAFNEGGTAATLDQELAKISGLNKQVKESIAKAARAKEDLKKVLLSGKLYMAIAPLTQLKLRAIVAAYYLAKRGVLEFHLYLKELKVLQIIADSENLSTEQKLIFKQAYQKGKELAEKDGKLATEIEEAMAKGDFEKLEGLLSERKLIEELEYSPTKKHMPGGWGTEMDLSNEVAKEVLQKSKQLGRQRYSYYSGKIYEFQPDNVGGWHGYPIQSTDLISEKGATGLIKSWLDEGLISKAEYNKIIKNK